MHCCRERWSLSKDETQQLVPENFQSAINHFYQWLIKDKEVLKRKLTWGLEIKVQQALARYTQVSRTQVKEKLKGFRD